MRRDEALAIIAAHKEEFYRAHHVRSLRLFGSVARDDAVDASDVDVLVEFDRPVGLFTFVGLKMYMQEILGKPVDLATPDALHPRLRDRILGEAIRAA